MEEIIEVHAEGCNCNRELSLDSLCKKTTIINRSYRFTYAYKKYIAKIHPCIECYSGVPHKEILDIAIKNIKDKKGIKYVDYQYQTSSLSNGMIQCPRSFREDPNTIIEVVSVGGFNRTYYVEHKIEDLDIEEIIKYKIDNHIQFKNIFYLLLVTKNEKLFNEEMKKNHKSRLW